MFSFGIPHGKEFRGAIEITRVFIITLKGFYKQLGFLYEDAFYILPFIFYHF